MTCRMFDQVVVHLHDGGTTTTRHPTTPPAKGRHVVPCVLDAPAVFFPPGMVVHTHD
jgi:hypothetical protein